MRYIIYFTIAVTAFSCSQKQTCPKTAFNLSLLDSIKQKADTSFTRKYSTEEFAMVDYFINRKDSTASKVMKDTAGAVRQIIMVNRGIRFFTAEYFDNGQLKAKLPFDKNGKFDGPAEYYFESGCLRSSGNFVHGFFHGEWRNFDEKGGLVSIDSYDDNGQLISSSKK